MKKALLTLLAALLATAIHAQVSVWDGTAEPWTQGSGTQNDPYLIENAQQLAYLAEKTNQTIYGYHVNMYADTCFRLATDLDLGADNGLLWMPIGAYGATLGLGTRSFGGNFDGGNHTISNFNIADNAMYFGLFGSVKDGEVKNIIIDGDVALWSNWNSPSTWSMDVQRGLLIGCGENTDIEDCVNHVNISLRQAESLGGDCIVGALFGKMANSSIRCCYNYGNIIKDGNQVLTSHEGNIYCGGVAGVFENCEVEKCLNKGNLAVDCEIYDTGQCFSGGIAGKMTGSIRNCYCVASQTLSGEADALCSGGIIGHVPDASEITISNCYYVGEIDSDIIGGIVGSNHGNATVENSYYTNTIPSGNDYGVPKTESEMQSQDFVSLLNNGSNIYSMDDNHVNGGFPVFAQDYALDEAACENVVSIYPNPAKDIVNFSFTENVSCNSIGIYSPDGRLVNCPTSNHGNIDISAIYSGIYLIKIVLSDGSTHSYRLIKE